MLFTSIRMSYLKPESIGVIIQIIFVFAENNIVQDIEHINEAKTQIPPYLKKLNKRDKLVKGSAFPRTLAFPGE